MRKLFTFICILIAFASSAQISIVRSDYGSIGDKVRFAVDTPASATLDSTILLSGANQTWDFSTGLMTNKYDSMFFTAPGAGAPAATNLVMRTSNTNQFLNVDTNFVNVVLDRPTYNITGVSIKVFSFPFTDGSILTDTLTYVKSGTPASFNLAVLSSLGYDSVKVIVKGWDTTTCLGYGTLNLPDTSSSVLKVKITTISDLNFFGHQPFLGWSSLNSLAKSATGIVLHQKSVEYQWIGKNSKSYIARALMDSTGQFVNSMNYLIKKIVAPAIVLVSPNTGVRRTTINDTVQITVNAINTHFTQNTNLKASLKQGTNSLLITTINKINDSILTITFIIQPTDSIGAYKLTLNEPVYGNFSLANAFTINAATGINEQKDRLTLLSIYPNPAKDELTISFPFDTKNLKCEIFNLNGQLVFIEQPINNQASNSFKISLENISSGMYFLKITDSQTGEFISKRIVKE